MDFVSFLFGVFVGLVIAYGIIRMLGKMLYNKLVDEGVIKSEAEESGDTDSRRIEMKVEKHGDVWYAFDATNDDFVCQGLDLKELKANFVKRFPGYDGAIVDAAKDLQEELIRQKKELSNAS